MPGVRWGWWKASPRSLKTPDTKDSPIAHAVPLVYACSFVTGVFTLNFQPIAPFFYGGSENVFETGSIQDDLRLLQFFGSILRCVS
jgi:hypothetical protein